jgi:hypothetical protein
VFKTADHGAIAEKLRKNARSMEKNLKRELLGKQAEALGLGGKVKFKDKRPGATASAAGPGTYADVKDASGGPGKKDDEGKKDEKKKKKKSKSREKERLSRSSAWLRSGH